MRPSREFVAILTVFVLHSTQQNMMRPFVPLYASSVGVGYLGVGVVVAALALLPMFLAVPAGVVTDRRGIRPMILSGG